MHICPFRKIERAAKRHAWMRQRVVKTLWFHLISISIPYSLLNNKQRRVAFWLKVIFLFWEKIFLVELAFEIGTLKINLTVNLVRGLGIIQLLLNSAPDQTHKSFKNGASRKMKQKRVKCIKLHSWLYIHQQWKFSVVDTSTNQFTWRFSSSLYYCYIWSCSSIIHPSSILW